MFLFQIHQENFESLLKRDGTHQNDVERKAMFYLFASNSEIMARIEGLYDFRERVICVEENSKGTLSSGTRALVNLGYNLYNNYSSPSVLDIFRNLDDKNFELAMRGIQIRFGKG
ncbi:DUF6075 family protein [Niallia sp. MER TA 168]|uniref:DUF6075 family protein n=1 Tax=Niallia sp. MER TA 168 TaxID=2939568 RepID=UPI002041F6E4|nr:DUF6075 family protein [Niallia sp. MER TA 168]MCM3361244.1 DUF6075 family protein [Niallia sp. MER TA 168]